MLLSFIQDNIGSIIVGVIVVAIIVFAAWRVILDKKQGRSSCGCSCSSCPNAGLCHADKKKDE